MSAFLTHAVHTIGKSGVGSSMRLATISPFYNMQAWLKQPHVTNLVHRWGVDVDFVGFEGVKASLKQHHVTSAVHR